MARFDGSDVDPGKRVRLLELQPALHRAYPLKLPRDTLLFRCERCGKTRPLNHYSRNDQRFYGIRPHCRSCRRETRPEERHEPDPEQTDKRCRMCGQTQPVAAFSIDRMRSDGYSPWCKACTTQRKDQRARSRLHDAVIKARFEQTIRLCGELDIDYPGHDILRCRRCDEVKPLAEFVNDRIYLTRKKPVCLSCHACEQHAG